MSILHRILLLILLFGISLGANGQYDDVIFPPSSGYSAARIEAQSCTNSSPAYTNKWNTLPFHIPNANTATKTILINFNIFQDNNGLNQLPNNQDTRNRITAIMDWLNGRYNNSQSSDPIDGVQFIQNCKIRFELANTYFYQNSAANSSIDLPFLISTIRAADPSRMNQLNICFTNGNIGTPTAFTHLPSSSYMEYDQAVFSNHQISGGDFGFAGTLAHELGHCLNLLHTYRASCCPETCRANDVDFLDDVFSSAITPNCVPSPECNICYQDAGWNVDPYSPNNTATNNLMGGTQFAGYLSPKQMARMHKALAFYSVRRYVKSNSYSTTPLTVSTSENWDFNVKVYSDINVASGATLTISCELLLIDQAKIVVANGGQLIVQGKINLPNNNKIIIQNGGALEIASGSIMNLGANSQIDVQCNAMLCVRGGSSVNLQTPSSAFRISESRVPNAGACGNPASIVSGAGSLVIYPDSRWYTGYLDVNAPANIGGLNTHFVSAPSGGMVFYKTINNKLNSFYFNTSTNTWDWTDLFNAGGNVAGDLAVKTNAGQVFYRTLNNRMNSIYWANNRWNWSEMANAAWDVCGNLAIAGDDDEVFYRTCDNKLRSIYWANNTWNASNLNNAANNVAGDIVVNSITRQVFYRTTDNKINSIYRNPTTGSWVWTNLNNAAAGNVCGNLTISSAANQVFYKTCDNKINSMYFDTNANSWYWSGLVTVTNVAGDLKTDHLGRIFYRTTSNDINCLYWANNQWNHSALENITTGNLFAGTLATDNKGSIFFRANDNKIKRIYYKPNCFTTPSRNFLKSDESSYFEENEQWNEEVVNTGVTLFPNPANSNLSIQSAGTIIGYEIITLNGQTVAEAHQLQSTNVEVSVKAINQGIYAVKTYLSDGSFSVNKVIIAP